MLDPEFTVHPEADPDAEPLPSLAALPGDWVLGDGLCSGDREPRADVEPKRNSCGVVEGEPGGKVVVSVGNSRMEQFTGALIPLAEENGWTLITLGRRLPLRPDAQVSEECDAWGAKAQTYLLADLPRTAVVVHSTFLTPDSLEAITPGRTPRCRTSPPRAST